MITFRMYADVKMNRIVDRDKDYISPGGFIMKMGNEEVSFDFEESVVYVDETNPDVIHIEMKNPDYNSFEDLKNVTEKMLANVTEISEFFVYTGEPGETDLKPIELLQCTFVLPYNDWKEFWIDAEVCKKAVVAS